MKKFMPFIVVGIVAIFFVSTYFDKVESALSDNVLRLHVIANSDLDSDQNLKLKVRDEILKNADDIFIDNTDITKAKENVRCNLDKIEEIAKNTIKENGYDYKVKVSFGKSDFPTKVYGNITLPAGSYEALKVEIGEAKGKNWWCVMFPPLCFVDASTPKMDDDALKILKDTLSEDEYNLITNSDNANIEIKFKIYEMWQNGKQKVKVLLKR
ncbi:MAG: stage II sporulation protein R [Ruminococcaceae bacterium]|nr:stage II sporulation protein R [Oscillospiraceae bacterium]